MNRTDVMRVLKAYQHKNRKKYGILKLGVFGSVVRGTAGNLSDIDIVVSVQEQDLFNLIGIKQDLEEQFKIKVDVISYRPRMNPFLKQKIDQEAVYV